MFYHFIIHTEFEHGLSHSRANGSPSEEPDSALSNDLTVHRIGKVWWRHDSVSKAWSGEIKSCSYWHRWWIGRTQTPFPWALLILFDRDQRHDRDYTTDENAHNPLFCPGGNRFTNPALVWAELIWLWSGRVHSYTVLLHSLAGTRPIPADRTVQELKLEAGTSELDQWAPVHCQPMSHLFASTFLARYGLVRIPRVPIRRCFSYSPSVSVWTTSNPTRARSRTRIVTRQNLTVPYVRWDRLKVPNPALRNQCLLLMYVISRAQTDYGLWNDKTYA